MSMRTVAAAAFLALTSLPAIAQDQITYSEGSRPRVLINWRSFEANGFPASWRDPVTNVVINAYTRLNHVLGVDVRPQFFGYTDKVDAGSGEIVISANEKHACVDNRLASTFGFFPDRLIVIVHAKNACDLTPWNFTPFWPNPGEISLHAVLMHELQHTIGLDHSSPTKSIMGGYAWTSHYGPWSGDISDIRAIYRLRTEDRLRQLATYDGGTSWSTLTNDITGFGSTFARTTNKIAIAGSSATGDYVVGWTTPGNNLTWIRGDGVSFDPANWFLYTVHPRPRYGSAMQSDHRDTWTWAVVDGRNDDNRVRVIRSNGNAATWTYTNFPMATTAATPGLATAMIGGRRAWIVLWVNSDESNQNETGYVYGAVSFDNGDSWSAPHRVDGFYRVHDGVSIEANDRGQCWYSFVWAGEKGTWEYGQNKLRTRACTISPAGIVSPGTLCIQGQHSRVAPDLAWHVDTGTFVQGFREQDFATSIDSMRMGVGGCPAGFVHISGSASHVGPGMAANPAWSTSTGTEIVTWFTRE
jgi:Matrixin